MSDVTVFLPYHYKQPLFLCEAWTENECWKRFVKVMGENKEDLIKQSYSVGLFEKEGSQDER